jgi:hypothetical protein
MRYVCRGMQTVQLCSRDICFQTTKLVLRLAHKPDHEDSGSRTDLSVDATEYMLLNSKCGNAIFEVISFVFPFISPLSQSQPPPPPSIV